MPAAMPQPLPVDAGNDLLGECPAALFLAVMEIPGAGQRLAVTIRTASTTLTVLLNRDDAKLWAANIARGAAQMSAAGLVIAGGVQPMNGKPPDRGT
jgi:hypothetical protein